MSTVELSRHGVGDDGAADRVETSSPTEDTYKAHFASWLSGMSDEARQLAFLLEREEASAPLRRLAADSLNQLLHSADMIPEGTEALGYLETLFAFRMLAAEMSEAAYAAPRLPKPRPAKREPAAVAPAEVAPQEAAAPEAAGLAPASDESSAAELDRSELPDGEAEPVAAGSQAEIGQTEAADGEVAQTEALAADGTEAQVAEPLEAAAGEPARAEGAAAATELSDPELSGAEPSSAEQSEAELSEAGISEAGISEAGPSETDAAAAQAAAAEEEEPEPEPERADPSDESYAIARRLAPQAALVRAFLGNEDADRLRRLVLEQRSRASRGRSSKDILLAGEARAAAASEAREWAELYEAPSFGSTQHDLLRLRTFMKTRVRRTAS